MDPCGLFHHKVTILSTFSKIDHYCNSSCAGVCNQTCRNTIMEAKRSLGCCINLYNNSYAFQWHYINSYQHTVTCSQVWNSCGVELPGICKSTLNLTPSVSTSLSPSGSTSLSPSGSKNLTQVKITVWIIVALTVFI